MPKAKPVPVTTVEEQLDEDKNLPWWSWIGREFEVKVGTEAKRAPTEYELIMLRDLVGNSAASFWAPTQIIFYDDSGKKVEVKRKQ